MKISYSSIIIVIGISSCKVYADNYFNPAFIALDSASPVADLSHFTDGNNQSPGAYLVDIYLNKTFISTDNINFKAAGKKSSHTDDTGLEACMTKEYLQSLGVNLDLYPRFKDVKENGCIDLSVIPDAKSEFDFNDQKLNISIPQASIVNNGRGYIPPSQWDEGIPAFLMNYNFSGSNSSDRNDQGNAQNNYFLGLSGGGGNFGAWRLRDHSTFNYNNNSSEGRRSDWEHISTYLQRDIIALKGELTIGDSYTPNEIFDSLSYRGFQLSSDDNMLPDSLRGFAPTVRGIAKSNAQVTVRQNNYVIYQSYVPPGAFAINDLFPTSSSGDLEVEVKESNGSESHFTLPYSAVPMLQREGRVKYSAVTGEYRGNDSNQNDIGFAQGTLFWGLPHDVTTYAGTQIANNYTSVAVGGGVNIGSFGAISTDVTQAYSTLADDNKYHGQSVRFLYNKNLNSTGTDFQIMGYRYSTSGFYTLEDTSYKHMDGYKEDVNDDNDNDNEPSWIDYYNLHYTKKGKFQVNISQDVGAYGSLYLTGNQQTYWNTDENDITIQSGYSNTLFDVNYNISYSYTKSTGQGAGDQLLSLSISLPLSKWLYGQQSVNHENNNAYATYSINTDKHGNSSQTTGVNGTLLENNNLNYSVQQGYANHGEGANGNINLSYEGGYGNSNIGFNYDDNGDYQQINYGLSGGVIAHSEGVTFSQPLGETNVLIAIPGANDVKIENSTGIKTDWRGYTVVPYVTNYRRNRIALDTNSLSDRIDIDDAVSIVVPTKGAVVKSTYKAHVGERILLNLTYHGKPIPFGAIATSGNTAGIVDDEGLVYLSGMKENGEVSVVWGKDKNSQCEVRNYSIPASEIKKSIAKISGVCE